MFMRNYDFNITNKWSPVVSAALFMKRDSEICKLVCHKAQKIASADNNVVEFFLEIQEKLKSQRFNKKIIGQFINVLTNKIGYILENQEYHFCQRNNNISTEDIVYLVGLDVLKDVSIKEYREYKIEQILK